MDMGMREECKHFQSRTYSSGDVARFCSLGNAPDQPFSCPSDCMTYEPRMADVGWSHGSLVSPPPVATPESSREDREAVLAAAAEIVDGIAASAFADRRRELDDQAARDQSDRSRRGWRFWRR